MSSGRGLNPGDAVGTDGSGKTQKKSNEKNTKKYTLNFVIRRCEVRSQQVGSE